MTHITHHLLDGSTLTPDKLIELASNPQIRIDLTTECWEKVRSSRSVIEGMVKDSKKVVYGVNTGFGNFANKVIEKADLKQLQLNLIRSHSVGVGEPLSSIQVRMLQILRINTLAKGRSGISELNLWKYIDSFNSNFVPLIPQKGTVGASGDLAPLAHLALGMIGEGLAWCHQTKQFLPAADMMKKLGLKPIILEEKQGLALINGTQFMSSLTSQAFVKARTLIKLSKVLVAFAFDIFGLQLSVFDHAYIHLQKSPEMKSLLKDISQMLHPQSDLHKRRELEFAQLTRCSSLTNSLSSLSACLENMQFIKRIITEQINGTTDNPLVYAKQEGFQEDLLLSAGNFHGEYIAKAADMLAITLNSLGKFNERRIENYVNGHISKLPEFLCQKKHEGLNSGFMIAQCTSAALMSQNKNLVKPASIDSIPTSANQQDHVSMGGYASRKVLQLIDNLISMFAIELIMACQAIDILQVQPSAVLQKIHTQVRKHVPFIENDVFLGRYMKTVQDIIKASYSYQSFGKKQQSKVQFHFLIDDN